MPAPHRRLAALSALLIVPALLVACGDEPCCEAATTVSVQVDASPSGANGSFYLTRFAEVLSQRDGQDLTIRAMAIGNSTDPTEQCEAVPEQTVTAAGGGDAELNWRRSARVATATITALFQCAEQANADGSAVIALDAARGSDEVWLFSDAVIHNDDLSLVEGRLDDPDYVQKVVKSVQKGDALAGVTVNVYGAGVGRQFSNAQLQGLKTIVTAVIEAEQGSLGEWQTR